MLSMILLFELKSDNFEFDKKVNKNLIHFIAVNKLNSFSFISKKHNKTQKV